MFPLFCLFYLAIIKAEENFLISKFPEEYPEYKSRSNALLPKLSSLNTFYRGHKFNFVRVIKKEYGATFLYVSGMLALLFKQKYMNLVQLIICFAVASVVYLTIRYLKKSKRLKD